jgi:hypothetical protein
MAKIAGFQAAYHHIKGVFPANECGSLLLRGWTSPTLLAAAFYFGNNG